MRHFSNAGLLALRGPKVRALECGSAATAFPLPGPPMFPNKGGSSAAALQGELRSRISNDLIILLNRGGSQ
jgi:hypothetical protein